MSLEIIGTYAVALLLLIGSGFVAVGVIGLLKFNDPMTRLHAPTKVGTVGIGALLLASMLYSFVQGADHGIFVRNRPDFRAFHCKGEHSPADLRNPAGPAERCDVVDTERHRRRPRDRAARERLTTLQRSISMPSRRIWRRILRTPGR